MSQKLCADTHTMRPLVIRASLFCAALIGLAAFGSTGCEDKGIGRPCDVLVDAGAQQAVYNPQALECPMRICLKPVRQDTAGSQTNPTGPYCTAECSKDSDCDGEGRGKGNPNGCEKGFACGVAFEVGPLCCKKLCLCKDFLAGGSLTTPMVCRSGEACTQLEQ